MKKLFFGFILFAFLLQACTKNADGTTSSKYLPPSSGTHNELLLVCQDSLWNGLAGRALVEVFGARQSGLPQSESTFAVSRIHPNAFTSIFERAKSLVFAEFADTNYISIRRDVWARPQIVITVYGKDERSLFRTLKTNAKSLTDTLHNSDVAVVLGRMKNTNVKVIPKNLTEDLGIKSIALNQGFTQTLDKPEIKIFRQHTKKTEQFLVFSKRKADPTQIPGQDVVAARDSIGKHYFEGSKEGSYFTTELSIPPMQESTTVNGKFAIQTRGLWRTVGDFMGGPFISVSIYLDDTDEIVTIEGFIFGPEAKKRNVLLEMEAMMSSVKFTN